MACDSEANSIFELAVGGWHRRPPAGRDAPAGAMRDAVGARRARSRCVFSVTRSKISISFAARPGQAQQVFQCLERLQAAEHAGHRAQHTGLRAVADQAIARGFRPHAAQAGRGRIAGHQLQLSLVLIDAGEQHRLAGAQRHVVEQELGAEIVAAIEHQVVALHQALGIAGVESQRVRSSTRTSGFSARTRAVASAALSRPQSASAYQVWRCRFEGSSRSPSTMPRRPTPAPARYCSTGTPSPPAPTTSTARGFQPRLARGPDFAQRDLAASSQARRCGLCVA